MKTILQEILYKIIKHFILKINKLLYHYYKLNK